MRSNMEQLRTILQLVAMPVTGQVRFMPDDCCRLEQLAATLRRWRRGLPGEVAVTLTPGQEQILLQLERQLAHACAEPASPLWTDTAMRQSDGLRQARWLAREALVQFGWSLALPNGELAGVFATA